MLRRYCIIILILISIIATTLVLQPQPRSVRASNCGGTSIGFVPLIDMGSATYQGYEGGLYSSGSNARPAAHEAAGVALAQSVLTLNSSGQVSALGKIVLLSIGMSNTNQEFDALEELITADPLVNTAVVPINGAQPGQTAQLIANATAPYWENIDKKLEQNALTPAQVQVVWLKQAHSVPSDSFPEDAARLQTDLTSIVQILHDRYPNLKLTYVSSRIYGGYASVDLNPEPYAYQSGFAVKWLIEAQLSGDAALNFDPTQGTVEAPWLAWGPYLWADGMQPRSDGLTWLCSDFETKDGTHPSESGEEKVAELLLHFLQTDSTAVPWFMADGNPLPPLLPQAYLPAIFNN